MGRVGAVPRGARERLLRVGLRPIRGEGLAARRFVDARPVSSVSHARALQSVPLCNRSCRGARVWTTLPRRVQSSAKLLKEQSDVPWMETDGGRACACGVQV